MLNFKPSEFLDVMKEIRDELKAVRELLEGAARPQYFITTTDHDTQWKPVTNESWFIGCSCDTREEDET